MMVTAAAAMPSDEVAVALGTSLPGGLSMAEAARRARLLGANVVRPSGAGPLTVLARQVRSPLLVLLAATAAASFFLGERGDAVIIASILALSVGLGFLNKIPRRAGSAGPAQPGQACRTHPAGRGHVLGRCGRAGAR
jgi:Mg2+-importing ATPase